MRLMMNAADQGFIQIGDLEPLVYETQLNEWLIKGGWTISIAEVLVDVEQELLAVTEKVSRASDQYGIAVRELQGRMKNDIASISASATKAVNELSRLQKSIELLQHTMTNDRMVSTIANAERLATALRAMNELQQSQITFAVLEGKRAE